jgi:hypothetical protein
MIFFRRSFEIRPLFVTMLQIAARGIVLAAALGLTVGATSRAEAGQIITYKFDGSVDCGTGCDDPITGSFQVDSGHFSPSGNTDISSFITNLSFTANIDVPPFTFDPASGFVAQPVFVARTASSAAALRVRAIRRSKVNRTTTAALLQICWL